MLYENQVHAFLERCEALVGRELTQLRKGLASKRKHGSLWELVTLYVSSYAGKIDHEPTTGSPDVLVQADGQEPFWIEARHAESKQAKASALLGEFSSWIHRQLEKNALKPSDWLLRIDPIGENADPRLPGTHEWKKIVRRPEWRPFVASLKRGVGASIVLGDDGFACIVRATFSPSPHGFLSSGFLVPTEVSELRKHPVYTAIESKAEQARGWSIGTAPLVVCIGNTQESGFFNRQQYPRVSAKEAALAALHDTSKWHDLDKYNKVPRAEGQNHRVPGSSRISGVLLVSVEDRPLGVMRGLERRAQTLFILNRDAEYPLTPALQLLVASLPFDRIRFAKDAEPARAIANRKNPMRANHSGKYLRMKPNKDGSFEVDIPEQDLLWILAGKATPQEVFSKYGRTGKHVLERLATESAITLIERLPGDAEQGDADKVRIVFGPPRERLY